VTNPLTGEVKTGTSVFEYEVGMRSASVAAEKMNVFYVGVKNPVAIAAAGVSSEKLKVSAKGVTLTGSGSKRMAVAKKPGTAIITLSGGGLEKTDFEFRVKRIPDPVVKLGNKIDGGIKSGEFKAQLGLLPTLPGFEFDAKCSIQSYIMYYTPKGKDPIELTGQGARFKGNISQAIKAAKPGAQYSFTNVRARCPGDVTARRVNGLSFKIR
jgi:hypothetical protein